MERFVRVVAVVSLCFLGISAGVGSIPMIVDPSGHALNMPLTLLQYSPFHSFLLPGIVLLVSNGVFAAVVLVLFFRENPAWDIWLTAQGCILAGWITIEVILIRTVVWPQYVYLGLAAVLIACGWYFYHARLSVSNRS